MQGTDGTASGDRPGDPSCPRGIDGGRLASGPTNARPTALGQDPLVELQDRANGRGVSLRGSRASLDGRAGLADPQVVRSPAVVMGPSRFAPLDASQVRQGRDL